MTARAETPDGSSPDHRLERSRDAEQAADEAARKAMKKAAKKTLRRRLLDARAERSADGRAAATAALSRHVLEFAATTTGPIACYLPVGAEPGARGAGSATVPDALLAAGHEVLAPVVPPEPGPLDWTRYTGPGGLVEGRLGVREPGGPRLGVDAVAGAALVLVPALAVDRCGHRLGRGGGYYDRTLPRVADDATVVVLLHDGELLDEVPAEPHDTPVSRVLLPGDGVVHLSPDRGA